MRGEKRYSVRIILKCCETKLRRRTCVKNRQGYIGNEMLVTKITSNRKKACAKKGTEFWCRIYEEKLWCWISCRNGGLCIKIETVAVIRFKRFM
jgi:hypothetical protein